LIIQNCAGLVWDGKIAAFEKFINFRT